MAKVLVTGGCGYIVAHTVVDLLENQFDLVSVDNLSRGTTKYLEGIQKITGREIKNYVIDLCELERVREIFSNHGDITGIIHFAALKTVPESVEHPLRYFHNNLVSLVNLLKCVQEF